MLLWEHQRATVQQAFQVLCDDTCPVKDIYDRISEEFLSILPHEGQ